MVKNIRLLIPIALVVAGGVWGFNRWSFSRTHESTDNAQVDGHIVPVVAKVGGYVLAVSVGENAHVDGGGVVPITYASTKSGQAQLA